MCSHTNGNSSHLECPWHLSRTRKRPPQGRHEPNTRASEKVPVPSLGFDGMKSACQCKLHCFAQKTPCKPKSPNLELLRGT